MAIVKMKRLHLLALAKERGVFVTEAIWEYLPVAKDADALMVAAWPEPAELERWIDEDAETAITGATGIISAVRATRARYGISPRQELAVAIRLTGEQAAAQQQLIEAEAALITNMARLTSYEFLAADAPKPAESSVTLAGDIEVHVVLSGLVDFEAERKRLLKEQEKAQGELAKLDKKLSNENFVAKAAPEAVEKARAQQAELRQQLALIEQQLG